MHTRTRSLAAAAAAALTITAFGTAAGATTPPDPTIPERGDADLVIWTDDTRRALVEELAIPFAEENGVTVAVQELDFGQIREQLSIAGPNGTGPDIVVGAHDWLGELVSNGVLEPLDLSAVAGDLAQVGVDAFTFDGQTYGLPYATENIALVRNTDLVPEAPATLDEVLEIANAYKAEHPEPSHQGLALQVGPEGDAYHLQPILTAFGGYIFGLDELGNFNPEDVGIDSEGGLAAATFLQESAASGLLSADTTYDVMIESFGSGQAPFAITGPWALAQADNGFRATGVPYAVSAIPAFEGGADPAVFVGVQGFMVSSFSQNKDLAKSFVVDYMSQEGPQLAAYEIGGRAPAQLGALAQVADDVDLIGFAEAAANGIPQPAIPAMGNVWGALGLAQVNTLRGGDGPAEFKTAAETIRAAIAG